MRALVILPTYNEADNITGIMRAVRRAVPEADLLIVDDASPDRTAEVARVGGVDLGGVDVLVRPSKRGLGSAYCDGFRAGLRRGYRLLVAMDSDFSHDPAALPGLLHAADTGADLAVGSRYIPGGSIPRWSTFRRALSRWGNRYASRVLALPLADATSGFRAYRADMLARLDLASVRANGYGFQIEMAYRVARAGGRIVEIPIAFAERRQGTSKMSARIVAEAFGLVTWWGVCDRIPRPRRRESLAGGFGATAVTRTPAR